MMEKMKIKNILYRRKKIMPNEIKEEKKKMLDPEKPLFMPNGSVRDLIALIFAIGLCFISYKFMTTMEINTNVFNVFVNAVMLVLGYYFGNRSK
jgi:hypothetical protein